MPNSLIKKFVSYEKKEEKKKKRERKRKKKLQKQIPVKPVLSRFNNSSDITFSYKNNDSSPIPNHIIICNQEVVALLEKSLPDMTF